MGINIDKWDGGSYARQRYNGNTCFEAQSWQSGLNIVMGEV